MSTIFLDLCQDLPAPLIMDLGIDPCGGGSAEPVEGSFIAETHIDLNVDLTTGTKGVLTDNIIPIEANFSGWYDDNVWRGKTTSINSSFERAIIRKKENCFTWYIPYTERLKHYCEIWNNSKKFTVSTNNIFKTIKKQRIFTCLISEKGESKFSITSASTDSAIPYRLRREFYFEKASSESLILTAPYILCWPRRKFHCTEFVNADRKEYSKEFLYNSKAKTYHYTNCNNFEDTKLPLFIWPIPESLIEPIDEKFYGSTDLDLKCILPNPIWAPIGFNLGLDDICNQSFRPLDKVKVIIMTHDLWIKLISDGTYIPCNSISLSIDRDSWGWSWSANLSKRQENLINTQQYVEINIDGYRWKGIVEKYSGNESFNSKSYTIGGRSLSAFLTSPYTSMHSRNELNSRTMKQLVEDEVEGSGWTINWDSSIIDWTVPGGVFSYSNKTTISAIMSIIQSIDCTLQSDMYNYILHVIPKYKVAPWNLDSITPDKIISVDYAIHEGITWEPKELMNGVWVSGVTQGIRVKVYRDGTDGSPFHPMIIDPLITHVSAGIQRGQSILSSTGKRRNVSLTFPIINSIGILKPCDIIEVTDSTPWRGYIDSIQISGNLYSVYQTVTIEDIQEV